MDTLKTKEFDLLMNGANEFLIVFPGTPEMPQNPRVVFDRRAEEAFLFKTGKDVADFSFSPLPEEALEPLSHAFEILCVEMENDVIQQEYIAKIEHAS